ncbi:hypothetical protein FS837_012640, partial [Tulasnella sp. UAMH 9824]
MSRASPKSGSGQLRRPGREAIGVHNSAQQAVAREIALKRIAEQRSERAAKTDSLIAKMADIHLGEGVRASNFMDVENSEREAVPDLTDAKRDGGAINESETASDKNHKSDSDKDDKPDWWKNTPKDEDAAFWLSSAKRSYKMRAPDLPGYRNITLSPLLILQISCNTQDFNPSFSVAKELWRKLEHVYGSHGRDLALYVEIQVNSLLTHADPAREQAKQAATEFLRVHPKASVIIVLDAHSYTKDGTVVVYDPESAPLPIALAQTIGGTLWAAINAASGPLKVLVPMVCGWLWASRKSVDQAKDVMRRWLYQQPPSIEWADMPPLCNHVIGFSSTALIPWTVSSAVSSALEEIVLTKTPVLQAVELRICLNHELTRGTGVILGAAAESGEPEYH